MYGCVVHKRVWKEVPKENTPAKHKPKQTALSFPRVLRWAPRHPFRGGWVSFRFKTNGPRRRPESLSPCLLHLHTMLETSEPSSLPRSSSPVKLSPLSLPLPSRRIIGISLIRPSVEIIEGETKMSTPSADREVGFWIKDDV